MSDRSFDLENRLIDFGVMITTIAESLPSSKTGSYIANQMIRSGLSPALNYGEARSAESIQDFIHKMKISLKELRETNVSLQIIKRKPLLQNQTKLNLVIDECNELISIFVTSIKTAEKNSKTKK